MVKRYILSCFECRTPHPSNYQSYRCEKCGGLLEVRFDLAGGVKQWTRTPLSVWRYREVLPVGKSQSIISLGEGGTGLHHCERLGRKLGLKNMFTKNEGENPTGSFKDRGMTVAISKAIEFKKKKVVCASTGNTAASLAAYSARAGLTCIVLVPRGNVASGKMVQVVIHGARIIQVRGNFDQALARAVQLAEEHKSLYLMNSVNPFRLEGQKTVAFEIFDQLERRVPDLVVLPVGNGGNISATWKGFGELLQLGLSREKPRLAGIQARNASPIVATVKKGTGVLRPLSRPETIASAIRIGSPVNWPKAVRAIRESNGFAESVTDTEILRAQRELARYEGLFVEPAAAASVAGVAKMVENGMVDRSDVITCVATGHGLKDPSIIDKQRNPLIHYSSASSVAKLLELGP